MSQFTDFGLAAPLLKALAAEGYEIPTPIQTQAVPHVMAGRDICGIAQTGTGKTAAFALPILHRLQAEPRPTPRRACRVLVLAPTRELASQIEDSFRTYGRQLRLTSQVVFGGVPVPRQERALANGADMVVATPGRLLDLVERRSLSLGEVEILVLDEADQMLDLGFIHDLKRIVKLLPKKRQTLFFSATMPPAIATLADAFLTDPVKVAVAPVATTAERVEQQVIFASTSQKQALLHHLLKDPAIERVLVFTRTKHGANRVVGHLEAGGFQSAAIHGNKSQAQREKALAAFKAGECRVLVATDIAARGIDVDAVTHVINFDLPNVAESYVHRIGRTARAGAAGIAISFCNDEERAYLRDIERLTRQKVPVAPLPAGLAPVAPVKVAREEDTRSAHFRSQAQRQRGRGQPGRSGAGNGTGAGHGRGAGEPRREAAPKRHDQPRRGNASGSAQRGGPSGSNEGRSIGWLDRSPAEHRSR